MFDYWYPYIVVKGCGSSYHSWNSFKSHTYKKHPGLLVGTKEIEPLGLANVEIEEENLEIIPVGRNNQHAAPIIRPQPQEFLSFKDQLKWNSAKFLINLRESSNLSQAATTNVTEGVQHLHEIQLQLMKDKLLNEADVDGKVEARVVERLFEDRNNIFKGVQTKFLLDRFLIENRKLILPQKVLFGNDWTWKYKPNVELVMKKHFFYYIPFISSLTQLLNQDDILHCIQSPKPSQDDNMLSNYSDGYYVKSHPIMSEGNTLQIIVYYDDVEISNPLGSKCKIHKLGMFYWSLGNIYPEYRSLLKSINLLAISKTVHIRKYGITEIFRPFIQDMQCLESADGISMMINGNFQRFRGSVLFFTGDTLASNYVGGFKEGVSFAKRPCRNCMGTNETIKTSFIESDFTMRNAQDHEEQCANIEEPNLSKQAKEFWSKTYGINERSIFCNLTSFDISKCMVQDLMHVAIEGILELETRLFIKYCVDSHFVKLFDLNHSLNNFNYGHLSKDKPSQIDLKHLENKLRQSASQTVTLGNVLPFLLQGCIPEDNKYLNNFLLLIKIINLMLAFKIHTSDIIILKKMIHIHHTSFIDLYPHRPPTPKFHFLIHMPEQILRFGPLRHQWCMRFESVHCRAKHIASVVKNFKNIAYTVSYRYQSLRCAQLLTFPNAPKRNFLYSGHSVKGSKFISVFNHQYRVLIQQEFNIVDLNTLVLLAKEVIVLGTTYQPKSTILLLSPENDLPIFASISEIIVFEGLILFLCSKLQTKAFHSNLNAYEVEQDLFDEVVAVQVHKLIHPHPIPLFTVNSSKFVLLLHHRRTEFY